MVHPGDPASADAATPLAPSESISPALPTTAPEEWFCGRENGEGPCIVRFSIPKSDAGAWINYFMSLERGQ